MQFFVLFFSFVWFFGGLAFGQSCQEFAEGFLKNAQSTMAPAKYRAYLAKSLDLQNATKFSLGANWRTLTPEQRKQFYDVYSKYVVYKYASQLEKYKITEYKVVSVKPDEKRPEICNAEVVVKTTIKDKVTEIPLKSIISTKDAQNPLFQDLVLENISVLNMQRGEVESLLKSKGFDGMLKVFEDFVKSNS